MAIPSPKRSCNVDFLFFFNAYCYMEPNIYLVVKQIKPAIIDLSLD